MTMKIATWNVNGVRAREAQLQEFIAKEQPDVLCLQEIKATIDQLPMWLCDIEGYACHWHGGKGYSGVALHVRRPAGRDEIEFVHPSFDYENRIVTARLPQFTVASSDVPNGGKDFAAKMRFLEALSILRSDAGRALMERIISRGLVDVHRKMEPDNENLFTWWAPWRNLKQRNIGWRLDLILASRQIADRTTSCVVQREFGASDHGPVIAEFSL